MGRKPRVTPDMTPEQRIRHYGWNEEQGPLNTPCWIWAGVLHKDGYGRLKVSSESKKVSRLAYEAWVGPIPPGEGYHGTVVRHRCDVRACINPAHLELGSNADNMRDKALRGEGYNKWEDHARAVLDWDTVTRIRASSDPHTVMARKLGVSVSSVYRVRAGKAWPESARPVNNDAANAGEE